MNSIDAFNENGYDGISDFYELWCTGDENYYPSLDFYSEYLSAYKGPFLELGIGTGRIALEVLRKFNKEITGVDISNNMLMECNRRYKELKIQMPEAGLLKLVRENIKDIQFKEEFEVVYLPFRTIGHIMNDEELALVFRRVYDALMWGGRFVFDHYVFQQDWAEAHNEIGIPMFLDENNNISIVDLYEYDFDKEMMKCSIFLNGIVVQKFDFRWIHPEAIRKVAVAAGFTIENIYGSFEKDDFTEKSFNQIWELKK